MGCPERHSRHHHPSPQLPPIHTFFQADGIICELPFRVHLFSNNTLVFLVVKIAASIKTCFVFFSEHLNRSQLWSWRLLEKGVVVGGMSSWLQAGTAVVIGQCPRAPRAVLSTTLSLQLTPAVTRVFFLKMTITPRPPRGQRAVSRPHLHQSQSPPMLASAK